jgi:hypothetical protein
MLLMIPKRHKPALEKLVGLPPSTIKALVEGLRQATPAASLYGFTEEVLRRAKVDLSFEEVYEILVMLTSLYRVRTNEGWEIEDFVPDLIAAARAEGIVRSDNGSSEQLRESLTSIFESDTSLGVTAKALDLLAEHERTLCPGNCRILTDLRSVFANDVTQRPMAAVVQHMLKLGYHESDDLKEFYVALDSDDLRILRDLLDRAIAKEEGLKKMVDPNVPILGSAKDESI